MPNPFKIIHYRLPSGERCCELIDAVSGLPIFDANLYAVSNLRAKNLSVNTVEANLRAIMHLYLALKLRGIDLEDRLARGTMLSVDEVEFIVSKCRLRVEELVSELDAQAGMLPKAKVVALKKKQPKQREISSYRDRIDNIKSYLDDLALRRLPRFNESSEAYLRFNAERENTLQTLGSRRPTKAIDKFKGPASLTEEEIKALFAVLDPYSEQNPFKSEYVRRRNALIMHWLVLLGMRTGELLGVRLSDIDWPNRRVLIIRRHDDKNERRKTPALVKNAFSERWVPMADGLLVATGEYLMEQRPSAAKNSNTPFLFLSRDGQALTKSGLHHIFTVIRQALPNFPKAFYPHLCRHTCAYALLRQMKRDGIPDDERIRRLTTNFGWSPTSKEPSRYGSRFFQEEANESSLKAQVELFAKRQKEDLPEPKA